MAMIRNELNRIRTHERKRRVKEETLHTKHKHKAQIKQEAIERKVRLALHYSVEKPLLKIEEVLLANEATMISGANNANPSIDPETELFFKNLLLNRYTYVSYAVLNGFTHINASLNEYGTILHYTVRHGLVESVNELCKYGADSNIQNALGNFPIHEVWVYYKRGYPHNKEEHSHRVNVCCEILQTICSYDTYVDHKDSIGNTCLMYAVKHKIMELVMLLLGFRADITLTNANNMTSLDIAVEIGSHDIARVLRSWASLSREFTKNDFNNLWHEFLRTPTATMCEGRDARDSLLDFESFLRASKIIQPKEYLIDDALLRDVQQVDKLETRSSEINARKYERKFCKPMPRGGETIDDSVESRPGSRMLERRKTLATAIALDGKFLKYTKRPATSSALMLSLRTPAAPLVNTEEEFDPLRRITSQGADFDIAMQMVDLEAGKARRGSKQKLTAIGAYAKEVDFLQPTDKQALLRRLSAADVRPNTTSQIAESSDHVSAIKQKVELIEGKRLRFVSAELLPTVSANSSLVASFANPRYPRSSIAYAKGRVRSTFYSKAQVEAPWSTVQHNYRTVPTDRTV